MTMQGRNPLGELRDNELAVSTMQIVDQVRPHASLLALALAVLFAVLAGVAIVRAQGSAERTAAWDSLLGAMLDREPGRMEEVASRYPETSAGAWAVLLMADDALADGNRLLLIDPVQAIGRLNTAVELYSSVNRQRPTGLAAERGIFGLARARECQGQLDEARLGYEAIVTEYPSAPFRPLAEERLAALNRPATQQWYKWFESPPVVSPVPPAEPGSDQPVEPAAEPTAG